MCGEQMEDKEGERAVLSLLPFKKKFLMYPVPVQLSASILKSSNNWTALVIVLKFLKSLSFSPSPHPQSESCSSTWYRLWCSWWHGEWGRSEECGCPDRLQRQ